MGKNNEVYAYFSISNFEFDPQEITEKVGILPTKSWKKGDKDKSLSERKISRWCLYSRFKKTEELEKHIEDVLIQLDEKSEEFRLLSNKFEGQMQLVGYFYQYYPGFYLESWMTEKLGYYKLSLDCDFYYLYSEKREDTY
jgi:hypothetical protein